MDIPWLILGDRPLEQALSVYDLDQNGKLEHSEADLITDLDLSNLNIRSLAGLNLRNLETLDFSNNQVYQLPSDLANMIHLRELIGANNKLGFVNQISTNFPPSLEKLDLSNNQIQYPLDLTGLNNLKHLDIRGNLVNSFDSIAGLASLGTAADHTIDIRFNITRTGKSLRPQPRLVSSVCISTSSGRLSRASFNRFKSTS